MYLESVIWILVILPRSSSHRYRRCSPTVFQGEEEGHLEKRIKARVIQSSSSDWASALVLVRKKDGSVQWCVDYWALNTVTVKDTVYLDQPVRCIGILLGQAAHLSPNMAC